MKCSTCGFVEKYQNRSLEGNILARVSTMNLTGSCIPSITMSTAIVIKTRESKTHACRLCETTTHAIYSKPSNRTKAEVRMEKNYTLSWFFLVLQKSMLEIK